MTRRQMPRWVGELDAILTRATLKANRAFDAVRAAYPGDYQSACKAWNEAYHAALMEREATK